MGGWLFRRRLVVGTLLTRVLVKSLRTKLKSLGSSYCSESAIVERRYTFIGYVVGGVAGGQAHGAMQAGHLRAGRFTTAERGGTAVVDLDGIDVPTTAPHTRLGFTLGDEAVEGELSHGKLAANAHTVFTALECGLALCVSVAACKVRVTGPLVQAAELDKRVDVLIVTGRNLSTSASMQTIKGNADAPASML